MVTIRNRNIGGAETKKIYQEVDRETNRWLAQQAFEKNGFAIGDRLRVALDNMVKVWVVTDNFRMLDDDPETSKLQPTMNIQEENGHGKHTIYLRDVALGRVQNLTSKNPHGNTKTTN